MPGKEPKLYCNLGGEVVKTRYLIPGEEYPQLVRVGCGWELWYKKGARAAGIFTNARQALSHWESHVKRTAAAVERTKQKRAQKKANKE